MTFSQYTTRFCANRRSLCLLLAALAIQGFVRADEPIIDEVLVHGSRLGPPLWRVNNGENVLWIFGYVAYLPKELEWDTNSVRDIMATAEVYFTPPELYSTVRNPFKLISTGRRFGRYKLLPDGYELEEILPEALYQRLLATKELYLPDSKYLLKLRPRFIAAALLQRATAAHNLVEASQPIKKRLERIAKRHKVKKQVGSKRLSLNETLDSIENLPFVPDIDCLQTTLDSIEDMEAMERRTINWANGDVSEYQQTDFPNVALACAWDELPADHQIVKEGIANDQRWLGFVQAALDTNKTSFASLPLWEIVIDGGFIDQLRNKGYNVALK